MKREINLKTVLISINLVVLILPIVVILSFRLYQNELIRQTEGELISQGAVLSAIYKDHFVSAIPYLKDYSSKEIPSEDINYKPVIPKLSLSSYVYPPRPDGRLVGIKNSALKKIGERLTYITKESQKFTLSGIKILDDDGVAIGGRKELGFSFAQLPEVAGALSGKYTSILRERISDEYFDLFSISRNGGYRIFVAMPVVYNDSLIGVIYLSRTPKNIIKDLYGKRINITIASIIILALVVAFSIITSYLISSPIKKLIAQVSDFKQNQNSPIKGLLNPKIKEYRQLGEAYVSMSSELLKRTEYVKQFAMDVSHEFKSPITAINGAVEILREHQDTIPKDKANKFLLNIEQDTQRLNALTNRLLELAEAESILKTKSSCIVSKVFAKILIRYEKYAVDLKVPNENFKLPISEEDLLTILINLIDNAFQHGARKVVVDFNSKKQMLVSDNGDGISKENSKKIFEPFFTTRRDEGGTGLGLKIVRSLLRQYGADINFKWQDKGTCFVINFNTLN